MDAKQYSLDDYWQVVSAKVCAKCIDGDGRENCRLSAGEECALKARFPKIVETVLSVKTDRMEPYIQELRKNVCRLCIDQSPDGTCILRSHLDCGLDRYFPLVVEAIEGMQDSAVNNSWRRIVICTRDYTTDVPLA